MTSLRNVAAIVEKEWRHYFGSPIAYVSLTVWALLFGIFFYFAFSFFLRESMMAAQQMEFGGGPKMSLNELLIRPVMHNMAVVALFLAPMLTMRLFAEEKRQGTIELLATAPLTDLQIVLGKFLAAAGLYGLMILAGLVDLALIWHYASTPPEWKPVLTGALALLLFGSCFLALGVFVSTLTRNQIVAGILSFCLFLGVWTLGWADDPGAGPVMKAIAYLGVTTHMEDMVKGVVDLKDVVFYLSFIAFGLFLAHQSVQSQRWRA
ncbi:MAG TPA: ABC transporter permease subunit [Actinomycetota bacterium]|nr:MAG: ABC transporter [Acidobacteriota bacterium]PYQ19626.1 MAG: ABC transporter [Acidobacteriota bacterium]HKN50341.1 ABC transporter permease subunit [Actinomycetota bacterium]